MVGVLIVTHGGTATELLLAARTIIKRPLENFAALSLDWDADRSAARDQIARQIARLDEGEGVLVLTDLLGGTPTNLALELRQVGRVEIVSGVNLPMVVRLGCLGRPDLGLDTLATWIQDKARQGIRCGCEIPGSVRAPNICEDPIDG